MLTLPIATDRWFWLRPVAPIIARQRLRPTAAIQLANPPAAATIQLVKALAYGRHLFNYYSYLFLIYWTLIATYYAQKLLCSSMYLASSGLARPAS